MLIGLIQDLNTGWWVDFQAEIQKRGLPYRLVDIGRHDWIRLIDPCTHIIWRPNMSEGYLRQAGEKLCFMEEVLGKTVYPNRATFWHYDNKNAQQYLAEYYGLQCPNTLVSYSYEDALSFLKSCEFPIVSKSAAGAGSRNVRLLRSYREAKKELDYLFRKSFSSRLAFKLGTWVEWKQWRFTGQRFYVMYQNFLSNNDCDTRIVTIGKRILGLRRKNRENDFRASGSGLLDYDPTKVDKRMVQIAYDISSRFGFQTMAYDFLVDADNRPVFGEMSYTFPGGGFLGDCPGYWDPDLKWHEGKHTPQELIIDSLVDEWNLEAPALERKTGSAAPFRT